MKRTLLMRRQPIEKLRCDGANRRQGALFAALLPLLFAAASQAIVLAIAAIAATPASAALTPIAYEATASSSVDGVADEVFVIGGYGPHYIDSDLRTAGLDDLFAPFDQSVSASGSIEGEHLTLDEGELLRLPTFSAAEADAELSSNATLDPTTGVLTLVASGKTTAHVETHTHAAATANARTRIVFTFEIDTPYNYSFNRTLSTTHESQGFYQLQGAPWGQMFLRGEGLDASYFVRNYTGEETVIDNDFAPSGELAPGQYSFTVIASLAPKIVTFFNSGYGPPRQYDEDASSSDSIEFNLNFSLTPVETFRWINPAGGLFSEADHWEPALVPEAEHTAIFDLPGSYTVSLSEDVATASLTVSGQGVDVMLDLGSHTYLLSGSGLGGPNGRLHIENVAGDPSHLTIKNGRMVVVDAGIFLARQGRGKLSMLDGGRLETSGLDTALLPEATFEIIVSGPQSRLQATRLSIASAGDAKLLVENGGAVVTGRMGIADVALHTGETGSGQVTITGAGSSLTVLPGAGGGGGDGVLSVGTGGTASLALLDGASATTGTVVLGVEEGSRGSVVIGGADTVWTNHSKYSVGGPLIYGIATLGGEAPADLLVDSGALLDTESFVVSAAASTDASEPFSRAVFSGTETRLEAESSISVEYNALLAFEQGATFTAKLLRGFRSTIKLSGATTSGEVHGAQTAVDVSSGASLIIEDGAQLNSSSVRHTIGGVFAEPALVHLKGAGSKWDMGLTDLFIGINEFGVAQGDGELRFEDLAYLRAHEILVGPGGRITGSDSTIDAHVSLLGGTIAPGLSPGTLTIDGDLEVQEGGLLEIEIAGLAPDTEHDQLIVTGDATINGTVLLKFINGFAPQQGQQFEFLAVGGLADLSGATFEIQNLAPGFLFDVAPSAGGLALTALSDGQFVPEPSTLPLLAIAVAVGMLLGLPKIVRVSPAGRDRSLSHGK